MIENAEFVNHILVGSVVAVIALCAVIVWFDE